VWGGGGEKVLERRGIVKWVATKLAGRRGVGGIRGGEEGVWGAWRKKGGAGC